MLGGLRRPRPLGSLILLAALSLSGNVLAQAGNNMCPTPERVIWGCTAGQKTYGLCASPDLSATAGYLQYRVSKGATVEFAYPSPTSHPRGIFTLSLAPRGASLVFQNGEYQYAIYEPLAGRTVISVSKNGTGLASISCGKASDTLTLTDTQNFFREVVVFQ